MIKFIAAILLPMGLCAVLCAAEAVLIVLCRIIPELRKRVEKKMKQSPFCAAEERKQKYILEQYEAYREKSEAD